MSTHIQRRGLDLIYTPDEIENLVYDIASGMMYDSRLNGNNPSTIVVDEEIPSHLFNIDPQTYTNWTINTTDGSYRRVGNSVDVWGEITTQSSPRKDLEFTGKSIVVEKEDWYKFSHLPNEEFKYGVGIIEFDENDYPKYFIRHRKC